ncbi:carbohydrate sulfotransferase 11-like [Penaeus monodon]|uniref:carbohydrate sulfotransferase 11-like n=1 Tax=Penaeus monodon TaxID=6687 RepID=UPI0018A79EC7|nr:carbohydrate sulfotransferase 11-like [Penaeus monodon]
MRPGIFPRGMSRLPRKLIITIVYMYCLLLVYRLQDAHQSASEERTRIEDEWAARARNVREECAAARDSLPLTRLQKNALAAAHVDAKLAAHYERLHLKGLLGALVYLPKRNFTWCIMPKVASTSWALALLQLEGYGEEDLQETGEPPQVALRSRLRPVHPDQVNTTVQPSLKFLFVRHPLERVVSAYRNKLEDSYASSDGEYFYRTYSRSIVQRFRQRKKFKDLPHADTDDNPGDGEDYRREPTFEEFVDYLINTEVVDYDEHWKPMWLQCHVCDLEYDYIIKYEAFQEESEYFMRLLKERKHLPESFAIRWENKGGTDREATLEYLGRISEHKLWLLYAKYQQDFNFFGYTMEGYTKSIPLELSIHTNNLH